MAFFDRVTLRMYFSSPMLARRWTKVGGPGLNPECSRIRKQHILYGPLSSDNSGTIVNYTWSLVKEGVTLATLHGISVSYHFSASGLYTKTLPVRD